MEEFLEALERLLQMGELYASRGSDQAAMWNDIVVCSNYHKALKRIHETNTQKGKEKK